MERDHVIAALKAHEQELRTAGVLSVSLFGSVARGEDSAHDVDVTVRLGENFSALGFNYFIRVSELGASVRHSGLQSGCSRRAGAREAFSNRDRPGPRPCLLTNPPAAKLGDLAPALMPDQPGREIRALGNRLRHEYDAIREDRLWDIVQIDLTPLCTACEEALRRLREGQTGL